MLGMLVCMSLSMSIRIFTVSNVLLISSATDIVLDGVFMLKPSCNCVGMMLASVV